MKPINYRQASDILLATIAVISSIIIFGAMVVDLGLVTALMIFGYIFGIVALVFFMIFGPTLLMRIWNHFALPEHTKDDSVDS